MRFTGTIEAKLDAKGRVFLPSAFRKVLELAQEDVLYLRKDDFEDCLTLCPGSVWDAQLDKLRASMNPFNRDDRNTFRQFVMNVEEVKLDGNGRFLIPKKMLDVAGLSSVVNFIGYDEVIELWSPEKQEALCEKKEEYPKALETMMSEKNN
ncbi:MAG: cell division/cell wall cluster transcriptional repressor MraZ [Bacteroidaceae bacterium]|nr:cell division/cell wall cluster transcriptional repressor MraZ [Bacteroidaceae bacterium]